MPDTALLGWEYTAAGGNTNSVESIQGELIAAALIGFVDFARFSLGPAGFGPCGFIAR